MALGLYSIGIRGIELEDLLGLAGTHRVPFLHLRGGPRGFNLSQRDSATLDRWARCSRTTVPITVVTADLDLVDFLSTDARAYRRASAELDRLGHAAAVLGARAIRLLARRVVDERQWANLAVPNLVPRFGLTTLIELHDPAWFTAQAVASMAACVGRSPWLALLVDTAQVHDAWQQSGDLASLAGNVSALLPVTRAVHVSDNGDGLSGPGHRVAAQAFNHLDAHNPVEVAFEWTGADRSVRGCLARYRRAVTWWHASREANQ